MIAIGTHRGPQQHPDRGRDNPGDPLWGVPRGDPFRPPVPGGPKIVQNFVPTGRVIKYPKKCALFCPPPGGAPPGGSKSALLWDPPGAPKRYINLIQKGPDMAQNGGPGRGPREGPRGAPGGPPGGPGRGGPPGGPGGPRGGPGGAPRGPPFWGVRRGVQKGVPGGSQGGPKRGGFGAPGGAKMHTFPRNPPTPTVCNTAGGMMPVTCVQWRHSYRAPWCEIALQPPTHTERQHHSHEDQSVASQLIDPGSWNGDGMVPTVPILGHAIAMHRSRLAIANDDASHCHAPTGPTLVGKRA